MSHALAFLLGRRITSLSLPEVLKCRGVKPVLTVI